MALFFSSDTAHNDEVAMRDEVAVTEAIIQKDIRQRRNYNQEFNEHVTHLTRILDKELFTVKRVLRKEKYPFSEVVEKAVAKEITVLQNHASVWNSDNHHEYVQKIRDSTKVLYALWQELLSRTPPHTNKQLRTALDTGLACIKAIALIADEDYEVEALILRLRRL